MMWPASHAGGYRYGRWRAKGYCPGVGEAGRGEPGHEDSGRQGYGSEQPDGDPPGWIRHDQADHQPVGSGMPSL
jgi:hypothetical protein